MRLIQYVRKGGISLLFLLLAAAAGGVFGAPVQAASKSPGTSANYEAWLNKAVHHQLAMLPYAGVFDNLEYQINGTQVTLLGQVVNPETKSEAAARVEKLEGVTRVVNEITELPLSPFDDQIRRAEFRAIFRDASLNRYAMGAVPSIHIIVNSGHVTLEGVVDNERDADIATIRANSVPGVFSVINHLRVDGSA